MDSSSKSLHIIYTERKVLLSKKQYFSWREIQSEFSDYKTSLGPWPPEEVVAYLQDEYPALEPSAEVQVFEFGQSSAVLEELTFRA